MQGQKRPLPALCERPSWRRMEERILEGMRTRFWFGGSEERGHLGGEDSERWLTIFDRHTLTR